MKKFILIIWLICLAFIFTNNSEIKKSNINGKIEPFKNKGLKEVQFFLIRDSVYPEEKPTSQQLYSEIERMLSVTANLKHDEATLVKNLKLKLGDNKNEISCYYSKNRLIRIENRVFNNKNDVESFRMFDFDENNNCFSNSIKDKDEESRIYAFISNYMIEYDSKLVPIILDSCQKQQIIQSARASLDSIMKHFPEFKYSMNWK